MFMSQHTRKHYSMRLVLQRFGVSVDESTQQIRCPVHDDKAPSARYYAEEGRVYCFACGKGWDALSLVMTKLTYDVGMALAWLDQEFPNAASVPLQEQLRDTLRAARRVTGANADALLDLIDQEIARVPTMVTALNLWTAVDYLRVQAEAGDDIATKAATLRAKVRAAYVQETPCSPSSIPSSV